MQAREINSTTPDPGKGQAVLTLIEALDNQTTSVSYASILDIAVVTETMDMLIHQQV